MTESSISLSASEDRCSVGKAVQKVDNTERQVFFRFLLSRPNGLRGLSVEWLAPGAQVMEFLNYEQLPAAPLLCFVTQMPLAGFEQATKPGEWTVRVVAGGKVLHETKFVLRGDPGAARGLVVRRVTKLDLSAAETSIVLDGAGMSGDSVVHLATYSGANAWQFIASMNPASVESGRLTVKYAGTLTPGEYWLVVKNPDGAQSAPARLVVASSVGYSLPIAAGEQWMITQANYGGTSHWGRSLHAWDIAPLSLRSGGCVTAMRAGIVHAFDRGEYQNSRGHSFGNFITIQHEDGEFSHYAHLSTGSFVVKTGQRVEAGQALARVGNSGHTVGQGGGYHVHAHVTRSFPASAQSIPFTFATMPDAARGKVVSNSVPLLGSCGVLFDGATEVSRMNPVPALTTKKLEPPGTKWSAKVGLTEWWSQTLTVPKGAKALDVLVAWTRKETEKVDVYLTSPSGGQYGGPYQNPERLRVEQPESGHWRISVQGVKGTGDPIEFEVRGNIAR
ncbi:M23 family metallopeptidase [Bryobacter aggregatus]|uniref:M23 family metallopeptidase n=1 Tax=Bryobacter aggregatus TaxID=360054 RepID=UPI001EE1C530|nr:M23 family metallopeptidase [Bryobacter aggregatus]